MTKKLLFAVLLFVFAVSPWSVVAEVPQAEAPAPAQDEVKPAEPEACPAEPSIDDFLLTLGAQQRCASCNLDACELECEAREDEPGEECEGTCSLCSCVCACVIT